MAAWWMTVTAVILGAADAGVAVMAAATVSGTIATDSIASKNLTRRRRIRRSGLFRMEASSASSVLASWHREHPALGCFLSPGLLVAGPVSACKMGC
jgi:hypothetical protein